MISPGKAPPRGRVPSVGHVPPHDLDAEAQFLGALLRAPPDVVGLVVSVRPELFYREAHRDIFRAIRGLITEDVLPDPVLVAHRLGSRLDDVGGACYLGVLFGGVLVVANARYYAGILKGLATLREIIECATEVAQQAYEVPEDVEGFAAGVRQRFATVGTGPCSRSLS